MTGGRSSDAAVGSDLAGYRIEALIGRGGMGAVYRAEEPGLHRKVALKVIAPELAQDERFRERFLRESQVAASLDHPHIVPIFKAGEEDGVLFLAMRYVEGRDLAKLVAEEGALEPRRAVELLSQVAEALDAAHEKGLVHRDVKPSNVLVTRAAGKEHCYLADFGLTKRTGSLSGISGAGDIVGTLEYVAPEQIRGDPLDARADVYSLGCVLYECLTGQPPFPRATDVALLWAHVNDEPPRPSQLRSELPREVDAALARALAKEPERRQRSAGELVAAARSALRLVETAPPAVTRRRALVASVAALVVLVLAAVAAVLLTGGGGGLSTVSDNSVGVIDPASNELVAEVPVGVDPEAIAVGEGGVWVANTIDGAVAHIDPATRTPVATIPVLEYPSDVTVGAGSVWVALGARAQVRRVEPEFNEIDRPKRVFPGTTGERPFRQGTRVVVGAGTVWYLWGSSQIGRLDIRTGAARQVGPEEFLLVLQGGATTEFSDLAFASGSLWLTNRAGNSVTELDPAVDRVVGQVTVGKAPEAIAAGSSSLWVANLEDDTVSRIDLPTPGSGQGLSVTSIAVGDGPVDVALDESGVWVANSLDRTVSRIDPDTNEVVATIDVGNTPQRIAAGEGAVWVTVRAPVE